MTDTGAQRSLRRRNHHSSKGHEPPGQAFPFKKNEETSAFRRRRSVRCVGLVTASLLFVFWGLLKFRRQNTERKFVAIHIGPIKTATTTIQMDSGRNENFTRALEKDGALYVGKYSQVQFEFEQGILCSERVIMDGEIPPRFRKKTMSSAGDLTFHDLTFEDQEEIIREGCWGDKKGIIEKSLVFSNEFYSLTTDDFVEDTVPLYQQLFIDYLGYDEIIIVAAYRRYGEWLSSAYKQRAKQSCLFHADDMCPNVWEYAQTYIQSPGYGTAFCYNLDTTLLPYLKSSARTAATTTTTAVPASFDTSLYTNTIFRNFDPKKSKIKFDVLNYFQLPREKHYNSITTELYCKSLGEGRTKNTCRYSRDERSEAEVNTVKNRGSSDIVKYHDIVVEAMNRGWIGDVTFFLDGSVEETTHNRRIREVVDLEHFHTKELGLSATDNLPLLCPSQSELQTFLSKSLEFEELIMPGLFNTKLGREEHIRSFEKMTRDKKQFCWLDIDRLFQGASSWEDLLHKRLVIDTW